MLGGTFAFFTDFANKEALVTAGIVNIEWEGPAQLSLLRGTVDDYNPSDGRLIPAKVKNIGNKSDDLRQTGLVNEQ